MGWCELTATTSSLSIPRTSAHVAPLSSPVVQESESGPPAWPWGPGVRTTASDTQCLSVLALSATAHNSTKFLSLRIKISSECQKYSEANNIILIIYVDTMII